MKVSLPHASVRQILRSIQFLLLAGALSILAYCAFAVADAWAFERDQSRHLDQLLRARKASLVPASLAVMPASRPDGLIGRLEITRLGISVIVVEGTSNTILRRA